MSDLGDFDDPESREYGRRWRLHKVMQPGELILVEPHYGIDTCGLDVTVDLGVALFFASNRFSRRSNGKAYYEPIQAGEHQGVCYAFVFPSGPEDLVDYDFG
jgi:hypothetical protein